MDCAGIIVEDMPEDRNHPDRIPDDKNSPQKHAAAVRVILATGGGGTWEITRRPRLSKPVVWHCQERFMREGVDGLLRNKTRPPGKPHSSMTRTC